MHAAWIRALRAGQAEAGATDAAIAEGIHAAAAAECIVVTAAEAAQTAHAALSEGVAAERLHLLLLLRRRRERIRL